MACYCGISTGEGIEFDAIIWIRDMKHFVWLGLSVVAVGILVGSVFTFEKRSDVDTERQILMLKRVFKGRSQLGQIKNELMNMKFAATRPMNSETFFRSCLSGNVELDRKFSSENARVWVFQEPIRFCDFLSTDEVVVCVLEKDGKILDWSVLKTKV
jgi:hypothetical protein